MCNGILGGSVISVVRRLDITPFSCRGENMKCAITTEDKINEIEEYIEGLKDDDGVVYIENKVESLLNDALKIIKSLRYDLM